MLLTNVFGRIRFSLPDDTNRCEVHSPCDKIHALRIYTHYDSRFEYDKHGYETVILEGEPIKKAAYTAIIQGLHVLKAYNGSDLLEEITLEANPASPGSGFVEVSKKDPRYFALTDESSYVPIGPNLVGAGYDRLPAGKEHFKRSVDTATTGLIEWGRRMRAMKKAGANYTRIWLSNRYTQARTGMMGVHDPVALARFEALVELARENDIRLKLCLEHWRSFSEENHFAYKYYIDPDTGYQLKDENEWFTSEKWNNRWLEDIEPYLARCHNDPIVFAWELWNEIECGTAKFEPVTIFTERMLPKVKEMSPMNLVVNSLGSLDNEPWTQPRYDRFREIEAMEFLQVHRYLDQGAPMEICHTDPIEFSIDAVDRTKSDKKPIILTETGAVNDSHTGPFRFYSSDHDGLIFHDTTYPAFFAGAAGSGHIWHWDSYVEPKNLWRHYTPLVKLVEGVQVDEENFNRIIIPHEKAWIIALKGDKHVLALVRNKSDRWDYVLRDNIQPTPIEDLCIKFTDTMPKDVQTFWLMDEELPNVTLSDKGVVFPSFVHGCVIRIVL